MDFDDYENNFENCALVIEDLKSEDSTIKVQAVSKLYSIAQIIGKERVKEELIPYLIEIVEEKDNEDEFLLQLTEQLGQLSDVLDRQDVYHLLSLFEILVSMEEPSIRDKAIQKIKKISQGQDSSYFSGHYLNMVKRLSLWDHYPSRVAACYLFAPCYPYIPENERVEIRQLYSELAHDDTPMVRRAAAANLKDIVAVVDHQTVQTDIVPLFTMLVKDDIDSVKINAIESSVYLLPFYSKQETSENLIVLLKNTDPENKSWRVRYTLAETVAAFCTPPDSANQLYNQPSKVLDDDIVRKDVFPIYEALLKDSEQEVRSCALLKLAEIFSKLSDDQIENHVIPGINALITDTSMHVRLSVANALSELCNRLKPDPLIKHVLPLVQSLLKDEVIEVKSAAVKVLTGMNKKIGKEKVENEIFPLVEAIVQEKQWRCRLALIEVLPEICKSVGYETFKSKFMDFTFSFITDHFCLIREQTIENIKQLIGMYGLDKLSDKIKSTFVSLLTNENYLFRMTALTVMIKLAPIVDNSHFQFMLDNSVEKLGADKIPNVKFVFIKTLETLKDKISSQFIRSRVLPLLEKWKNDTDCDVAYFANAGLQNLRK